VALGEPIGEYPGRVVGQQRATVLAQLASGLELLRLMTFDPARGSLGGLE